MTWSEADHQAGLEYQDFIARELLHHGIIIIGLSSGIAQSTNGENLLGLEIKYDEISANSNRFFVETEYLNSKGVWTSSGIFYADKAWLYGIGNYNEFLIFSKKFMQRLALSDLKKRGLETCVTNNGRARGFFLPRDKALKIAEKRFQFTDAKQPAAPPSSAQQTHGVTSACKRTTSSEKPRST